MSDQLVVARFRGSDPQFPRFTRTSTVEELLKEVEARLPVDIVYFLIPHPDGQGYSFREAGLITIDVRELLRDAIQERVMQPQQPTPSYPSEEEKAWMDAAMGSVEPPQNPSNPEDFQFGQDPELSVSPSKSQQELLAERGLELPEEPKTKKKKKVKGKPTPSITEADIDASGPLPHPVSLGGHRKVTGVSQATQAEALAASKQIFR